METAWARYLDANMSAVFLSYSRIDTDAMLRLRDELGKAGIAVWTDDVGLEPGTPQWMSAIEEALERADCLLVVMSPEAKGSKWVSREVRYAEVMKIRIFPVLVRGGTHDAIPINLINTQRADLRQNYEDGVARLISVLNRHIRQVRKGKEPEAREAERLDHDRLDEDTQKRLSNLYTSALSAFWVQDWDKASSYFGQIVQDQPGFKNAAEKLEISKRQARLLEMSVEAEAAVKRGDWRTAEIHYEELLAADPENIRAVSGLEMAKEKRKVASLYDEATELHRAGSWQAVLNIVDKIREIEPGFEDPDDLYQSAERGHEEEALEQELSNLYSDAVMAMEGGDWPTARRLLLKINRSDKEYRETERLLRRIEHEVDITERDVLERDASSLISATWVWLMGLLSNRRLMIGVLAGLAVAAVLLLGGGYIGGTARAREAPMPSFTPPAQLVVMVTESPVPPAPQQKAMIVSTKHPTTPEATESPAIVVPIVDPYISQGTCGQAAPPCTYFVATGENFSSIAEKVYGSQHYTPVLLDYNRNDLGQRPSLRVGDGLFVPSLARLPALEYPPCGSGELPCLYTAGPGDTYESIALRVYGNVSLADEIEKANWDYDDDANELTAAVVRPGRALVVPVP